MPAFEFHERLITRSLIALIRFPITLQHGRVGTATTTSGKTITIGTSQPSPRTLPFGERAMVL